MSDKETVLPFADAPSIVRAHQKDTYFEYLLQDKLQDVVKSFTSQRFVSMHPEEVTVGAKALYLIATTLISSRTLGEEYVDLMYVSRDGRKLPRLVNKLGFVISYSLLPYVISRLIRKYRSKDKEEDENSWKSYLSSYTKVLDTITNLHVAIFYFNGEFYQLSKRIFGLRYAFGHNIKPDETRTGNYSLLGGLIMIQYLVKYLSKLKNLTNSNNKNIPEIDSEGTGRISHISQLTNFQARQDLQIDLSDPDQLPYIPESGRKCILCLSYMTDPSSAPCGHIFCWSCISGWCRENPECPLCRQPVFEQNLLPLK